MRTQTTLLTVLFAAAGLALAAPAQSDEKDAAKDSANPAMLAMPREAGSDIVAGRGPNPHAREIRRIAVYESLGNQDGVAMTVSSLQEFGITRQAIDHSVSRTRVHATSRDEREPGY